MEKQVNRKIKKPWLTPLGQRRWQAFKANKRGYWSLWIFLIVFVLSLFAELLANDRPLLVEYDGGYYFPFIQFYPETTFGGDLDLEADFTDEYILELIAEKDGWVLFPPIPFDFETQASAFEKGPFPSAPDEDHWFGTDANGRDVLARIIYGFRVSLIFGLLLTIGSSVVGIWVGAIQGYFGGNIDLIGQRLLEIWNSMPSFFILITIVAFFKPNFFLLLGITLLFSWTSLVGLVRAEFLRARNFEYVKAAKAMGQTDTKIMLVHILPNAMVATVTFMPFITIAGISALTALDYLGFGLPPGSASLGELALQARNNISAYWIIFSIFGTLTFLLSLLIFVGEGFRDAFDSRKVIG